MKKLKISYKLLFFISLGLNFAYIINIIVFDYKFTSTDDFNNIITPIAAIIALVFAYNSWKATNENNNLTIYQKSYDLYFSDLIKLFALFKEIKFYEHTKDNEILEFNISNKEKIIDLLIYINSTNFKHTVEEKKFINPEQYIELNTEYQHSIFTLSNYFCSREVLIYLNILDLKLKSIINEVYLNNFYKSKLIEHALYEINDYFSLYLIKTFSDVCIIEKYSNSQDANKLKISKIKNLNTTKKIIEFREYYFKTIESLAQ